ncbi:MAG: hypothetical protein JSS07_01400 [Proteobacteria bacterium]|nr:hypothetical protein [Pseudomonadota bacterium]
MKKQHIRTAMLSTIFIALLGIGVDAASANGSDGGGRGHAGGRTGGGSHDGGDGAEQNHDNDLQSGEWSSQNQRRNATNLDDVGIGEPTDPDNGYNKAKEYLREHR